MLHVYVYLLRMRRELFLNFTGCALIATSSRGVNYRHLTSAISNDSSFQRHVENLPRCNRIVTPAALFPSNAEKP